ncbi:chemerin-like receptor 1 [Erpetoichthys calabaricus]|uniref:chemerin-like receptor 1 n=1 Tax=Erpetoichthys calabaricus TaxID=27687 RepID=UPI0010A04036|nr:chemerin-like receptor 1 [Erpetoichthys calabaricus]
MNNTTNSTARSINDSLNIVAIVVYSFACILGCIGNGLVIWITGFKMKKTANTVWFLNLAIADFIFTTFLPLTIIYTANGYNWIFGKFMCQFNSLILCLTMFASVFLLTAISVDRCVAVVAAVWSQSYRSPRTASIACFIVWLLAVVLGIPYAAYRDLRVTPNKIMCAINYSSDVNVVMYRRGTLTIIRFLCGFLIPLIIIILCYSAIIWRYNNLQRQRCFKPFRIIVAVIVTFFICWAPFHIIQLLTLKSTNSTDTLYKVIRIGNPIVTSIAFLNSCLNPVLYVCMCQDFRHKFKKSVLLVLESAFTEEGLMSQLSQRRPTVQMESLVSLQKKNSIS